MELATNTLKPVGPGRTVKTSHALLDALIADYEVKNDAALARALDLAPAVVSKIRNRGLNLSGNLIILIHEKFGMPVARIKELARA